MAEATKREKRADHAWIDANGNAVDDIEMAVGNSYTAIATGKTIAHVLAGLKPGKPNTMFAVFGLRTLMTNEASQARTKGLDEVEALKTRLAETVDGQWQVPATREGGSTLNVEMFAKAVGQVKNLDAAGIEARRTKAEADPAWARQVLRDVPDIAQAYRALMGRAPTLSLDDV